MVENEFKLLAENSTDLISRHTTEGVYLYASPSCRQLLGFEPEELIGRNVFELFHEEDMAMIMEGHERKVTSSKAESMTFRIRTKDGSYKWVETISRIIRDPESNEPVEIHASTRDVSERKKFEDRLKTSIQEKSVLLQEVHHRVKNNLALVSGLISLHKYRLDNPVLEEILTDCELQIKSISLVHEKLYESANLARVNFARYISELFRTIQQIYDHDNEVEFILKSKSIRININQAIPVALILNELITNAYKHAFPGRKGKKLEIRLTEEDQQVRIFVNDNGPGLPDGFDYKKDASMGYTIVRTLLDQLGGEITFSSDGGTNVELTFKKRHIQGSGNNLL